MKVGESTSAGFERMKQELQELSKQKELLNQRFLETFDFTEKFDFLSAHDLLEKLLPENEALYNQFKLFNEQWGESIDDGSYLTLNTMMALLDAKAHSGILDGFDDLAGKTEELAHRIKTEIEWLHFEIDMARRCVPVYGVQDYILKLGNAIDVFSKQEDLDSVYTYLLDLVDLYLSLSDTNRAAQTIARAENLGLPELAPPSRTMEQVTAEANDMYTSPEYQLPPLISMENLMAMTAEARTDYAESLRLKNAEISDNLQKKAAVLKAEMEKIKRWSFFCDNQYRLNMALQRIYYDRENYREALSVSNRMKMNPYLQDPEWHVDLLFYSDLFNAMMLLKENKAGKGLALIEKLGDAKGATRHQGQLVLAKAKALLALERFSDAYDLLIGFYWQKSTSPIDQEDEDVSRLSLIAGDTADQNGLNDVNLHILLAEAAIKTGKVEFAHQLYCKVMQMISEKMKSPLGYRLDSTYLKGYEKNIHAAFSLCVSLRKTADFLNFSEAFKAKSLTAIFKSHASDAPRQQRDNLSIQEYEQLEKKVDFLELKTYGNALDPDAVQACNKAKEQLSEQRIALLEKIRIADPRWHQLTETTPLDIRQIQQLLKKKNQAMLDMYLCGKTCVVALVTGDELEIDSVELDGIWDKLSSYVSNLSDDDKNTPGYDFSTFTLLNASSLIPEKLLKMALSQKSLVISPHRFLHLLPWSTLIYNQKRLFEYLPVAIIPNLSAVRYLNYEPEKAPRAALFGVPDYSALPRFSPLPKGIEEMETLKQRYEEKALLAYGVCSGKEADETALSALILKAGAEKVLLHICCHGTVDPEDPMHSALILTDSILDASEIARLYPCPYEIILSACSTGYRPVATRDVEIVSDEVLGLPGAFLEAGAKTLLTSIPMANDIAAARFMIIYHQFRLEGESPMNAYQRTQITLLKENKIVAYKWTGFTLYGCV